MGNLGGFAAPYATRALEDLTGDNRAGMWAVGLVMLFCAGLVVALGRNCVARREPRAAPRLLTCGHTTGSTLGPKPTG